MQQILQNYFQKLNQMGHLYLNYAIRNNPLIMIKTQILSSLVQFLTMNKKKKMAQYRVNSQIYKVKKTEQLIAQSNEHLFLQGRKINEIR